MDPITGIGLVASIMQLVQFGISAAKSCQEIYQHGSTTEHAGAADTAGHLTSLTNSVQHSLHTARTQSAVLSKEENDLIKLARKCEDCAKKLQSELCKLQSQPGASHVEALGKAVRSIWKKNTIVKIQEQLEGYRGILEFSLLNQLSQRFDAQSISTTESFAKLDENLRHVILGLASSQTSLDMLVKRESDQTRQHINAQVACLKQFHIDEILYKDVTSSLFFPDISLRQEQVANEFDGIENTYEWIFDDQFGKYRTKSQWTNFPEWLRSGSKIYWINGKAGSGKSTLMNYICDHERKEKLLKQWSVNRRLLVPTFFFWNAGARLQKSIEGLLRSIIYQILIECRELIACFKNEPLYAWNEKRLLRALSALFTQTEVPVAICLFIDGLDEFDGPYNSVIDTINNLSIQNHVKVCFSSRPLLDFERAFAEMPRLRLQDLTFDSILAYANHQLFDLIEERISDSKLDEKRTRSLLQTIVYQAEGVFLWAVVAIRDVREGLQDMADLHELQSMIEDLPLGIENLYMQILRRIKPSYRREAMRFLQIISTESVITLDLYKLYFIDQQRVSEDLPLVCNRVDINALVGACNALRTRLLSHTLGLLDLVPLKYFEDVMGLGYDTETESDSDFDQTFFENECNLVLFTKVSVHHRTVKEFLLHNIEAKSFVADAGLKKEHIHLCIARGTLAYLVHLAQDIDGIFGSYSRRSFELILMSAFEKVVMVENLVGAAQTKFMQSLHDYSLMPKSLLGSIKRRISPIPYIIHSSYKVSIDLIPMAVDFGMLRYVCEVLELPSIESQRPPAKSVLDHRRYVRTENTVIPGLSWVATTNCDLHPLDYRRRLHERLEWKMYVQGSSLTEENVGSKTLVETYLLARCNPEFRDRYLVEKLSLIQMLLQAGANPMVRVEPATQLTDFEDSKCFWSKWLHFLGTFTFRHVRLVDKRVKFDDIFDTTKALLAQGANLDFSIAYTTLNYGRMYGYPFKDGVIYCELHLEIETPAIFLLEKCLSEYPEFRYFAAAVEPQITSPRRKISSITTDPAFRFSLDSSTRVYPDDEESKMLWPLIEKFEATGERYDLDALESAMERVWKAHRPGERLSDESDSS